LLGWLKVERIAAFGRANVDLQELQERGAQNRLGDVVHYLPVALGLLTGIEAA
jgi:hypothetical protein